MPKKTGPLTKVEKFYLDNHSDSSAKELAEELNRTQTVVSKYIKSIPVSEDEDVGSEEENIKVGDLMARNTKRGVATMTEAASMLADAKKPNYSKNKKEDNRYSKVIHTIKKEEDR